MKRRSCLAILLLFGFRASAQEGAISAQPRISEVHLTATVEAVVPLTSFRGEVTPIDTDPRFALTLRVETAKPFVAEFAAGAVVTFAVHSPSLLFAGEPTKSRSYNFYLQRATSDDKVRLFGIRVGEAGHGKCAEDDEPVGYPLKGWIGYTNTGVSVPEMSVQALTSPDKPPVATAKTDAAGRFSMPTLGPGKFYLRANKEDARGDR